VWSVPAADAGMLLSQGRQSVRRRWKPAGIEVEQIECAAEALHLDLRSFDLRFAEIVENARADQAHDETDDGNPNQHLDQCETMLAHILSVFALHAQHRKPALALF